MPEAATATEETTTEAKPKVDPFMEQLAASMGAAVQSDGENIALKPLEPTQTDKPTATVLKPTRSIGEMVEDRENAEAKTPKPDATEATASDTASDTKAGATDTTSAATTTSTEKKDDKKDATETTAAKADTKEVKADNKPVKSPTDDLARTLHDIKQVPATGRTAKPGVVVEMPKEDAEYVKTLTDEQREELRVAKFAEAHANDGIYKRTLAFFRANDEFVARNPGLTPDSEEFQEFIEKNRPKWNNRAKVERQLIKEETKAEVQTETAKEMEELRAHQRQMEIVPKIEKAVNEFQAVLTSDALRSRLPEEVKPISPKVAEVIKSSGYEAAVKKYPILAPIYQGAVTMAQEYLNVVNGITPWAPDRNGAHAWLANFIAGQENYLGQKPVAERTVDGKLFVPAAEYAKLKPEELSKHWTRTFTRTIKWRN